ncbi:glycosyltransferase [Frondihabitans cladoniiphilus]|uniref:Glycosyl transferase family 1 domain-containing protein n=1 Tax=Frondihabitans cladoniiphilus TaxID=715785 RepID=A0ABP8WFS9_9MICO
MRPETTALHAALRSRVEVVARTLSIALPPAPTAAEALEVVARRVAASADPNEIWLLHVAITGVFPEPDDFGRLRRALVLSTPATAYLSALEGAIEAASQVFASLRSIEVVRDEVLVDVDYCARWEHNTGIQRVVRHTVPEWQGREDRPHRLVAWTEDQTGYTSLTERQLDRVLHWSDRRFPKELDPRATNRDLEQAALLVPWKSTILVTEVPADGVCPELSALAQFSPNRVSIIGYDAIPLVSADTLPDDESERFAHFLSFAKHVDVIAGISGSAADEFRAFASMLPSQGVEPPEIVTVSLATEVSSSARAAVESVVVDPKEPPLIICVGSHEPRKNQEAVLFAAQVLFREGLDFRIVFVGSGSRQNTFRFDAKVSRLQKEGMRVESHRRLGDDDLWSLFARARFSVFVSLHEGFGLPVAESLAFGTPVLTSDFGSLDEVASVGGCVQVDPRDDESIVDAMRRLLVDDELVSGLHGEITEQTPKSWGEYADELWQSAVAPLVRTEAVV